MKTDRSSVSGLALGDKDTATSVPALAGPLLGLTYIILLPFVGIAASIMAGANRVKRGLANIRHEASREGVDMQELTTMEALAWGGLMQPLIDELKCKFLIIDREFCITQYHTPVSRQNKVLEQTAIGQHCYEVSHSRSQPCESCDYECPVRKVFETGEKVKANHYHENLLEENGIPRLVNVLALPVRDNQGNITQVAELIWEASGVM